MCHDFVVFSPQQVSLDHQENDVWELGFWQTSSSYKSFLCDASRKQWEDSPDSPQKHKILGAKFAFTMGKTKPFKIQDSNSIFQKKNGNILKVHGCFFLHSNFWRTTPWPPDAFIPSNMLLPTCFQSVGFKPTEETLTTQFPGHKDVFHVFNTPRWVGFQKHKFIIDFSSW